MCHFRVIFVSEINRIINRSNSVFTLHDYVVIDGHNNGFCVAHQLRDPLDRNLRDLIAEHGAVVVPKNVGSKTMDRLA